MYIILLVAYLILTMLVLPDEQWMTAYNLSPLRYRIIFFLTVYLPLTVVWIAAFAGYRRLNEYSRRIKQTPEGPSFALLTTGTRWLAWGLPVVSIVYTLKNLFAHDSTGLHDAGIITTNFLMLIVSLFAFMAIGRATRKLTENVGSSATIQRSRLVMFIFVLLGVAYCYLLFRNTDPRLHPINAYHLPFWLIVISLIIPYLYAWFVGVLAAFEINAYKTTVKGILYKQALSFISRGFISVIAALILIQYLASVPLEQLTRVSFAYLLFAIYVLLALYAIGFVSIALGAKKLIRLEEV